MYCTQSRAPNNAITFKENSLGTSPCTIRALHNVAIIIEIEIIIDNWIKMKYTVIF